MTYRNSELEKIDIRNELTSIAFLTIVGPLTLKKLVMINMLILVLM